MRINNIDNLRSKLRGGARLLVALGALLCIAPGSVAMAGCITPSVPAPCIDDNFGEIERHLGTNPAADLAGLSVVFANESRPGRPRFDIVIANVPRSLFTNFFGNFGDALTDANGNPSGGFGDGLDEFRPDCDSPDICPGDEIGIDGFTATFDPPGDVDPDIVFGINNVQIVAQEIINLATGQVTGAEQDKVWVLWSIRFEDVTGLSPSTLTIRQGNDVLATFVLEGTDTAAAVASMTNGLLTAVDGNAAGAEPPPPPGPAPTVLDVTKWEFKPSRVPGIGELKIEGINAVPGATITLDGSAVTVAAGDGRFRFENRNFDPPDLCQVMVSDGTTTVTVLLPNC